MTKQEQRTARLASNAEKRRKRDLHRAELAKKYGMTIDQVHRILNAPGRSLKPVAGRAWITIVRGGSCSSK